MDTTLKLLPNVNQRLHRTVSALRRMTGQENAVIGGAIWHYTYDVHTPNANTAVLLNVRIIVQITHCDAHFTFREKRRFPHESHRAVRSVSEDRTRDRSQLQPTATICSHNRKPCSSSNRNTHRARTATNSGYHTSLAMLRERQNNKCGGTPPSIPLRLLKDWKTFCFVITLLCVLLVSRGKCKCGSQRERAAGGCCILLLPRAGGVLLLLPRGHARCVRP